VTSAQLAQLEPLAVQDWLVLLVLPVHLAPRARLETKELWAVLEQLVSLELRVRRETWEHQDRRVLLDQMDCKEQLVPLVKLARLVTLDQLVQLELLEQLEQQVRLVLSASQVLKVLLVHLDRVVSKVPRAQQDLKVPRVRLGRQAELAAQDRLVNKVQWVPQVRLEPPVR
jgi:hypothetical protein